MISGGKFLENTLGMVRDIWNSFNAPDNHFEPCLVLLDRKEDVTCLVLTTDDEELLCDRMDDVVLSLVQEHQPVYAALLLEVHTKVLTEAETNDPMKVLALQMQERFEPDKMTGIQESMVALVAHAKKQQIFEAPVFRSEDHPPRLGKWTDSTTACRGAESVIEALPKAFASLTINS